MRRLAALLLILASPAGASGQGPVAVLDADTLDVGGVRMRLHGVDAPESDQTCLDAAGLAWACGAWATAEARRLWEGRYAACERLDTDRHGRAVSRCRVDGADLGQVLVERGLAFAYHDYSTDYVAAEGEAARARLGVWQGEAVRPALWRAERREPEGCRVKGNVSERGRIYHLPGGPRYEATRIDAGQGERWFCSAAEAEAAGWRAPRA